MFLAEIPAPGGETRRGALHAFSRPTKALNIELVPYLQAPRALLRVGPLGPMSKRKGTMHSPSRPARRGGKGAGRGPVFLFLAFLFVPTEVLPPMPRIEPDLEPGCSVPVRVGSCQKDGVILRFVLFRVGFSLSCHAVSCHPRRALPPGGKARHG